MCLVYEAEHLHLKQAVALKLLKPELATDPTAVARFAQEAQASAQLRSPNVARVYDVDKLPDGQPYITMELLVGHDLGTELQRRYALPVELAVDYVCQAATGISEAHTLGIVHRDLKPENLYLTDLGAMTERRLVKILDFGIAKNVRQGEAARKLTAPDAVFGTVDYMSPEQIRSSSTVDHRTDLWSLGVILFELLTGRTPYSGDARSVIAQIVSDPVVPPSRFVPTLPLPLVAVVMKALAKDPDQRFQSAEALRMALEPFRMNIEPISDVMARLPAASVPRRSPQPSRPGPDVREVRDVRTNLSFETASSRGSWAKRHALVPLCGAAIITFIGVAMWKKNLIGPRHVTTQQTAVGAVTITTATAPATTVGSVLTPSTAATILAIPPPPAMTPAVGVGLAPQLGEDPSLTSPAPAASTHASPKPRWKPATRPSADRAPTPPHTASTATEPPPAPSQTALPKHI